MQAHTPTDRPHRNRRPLAALLATLAFVVAGSASAQLYGSAQEVIDAMDAKPAPTTTVATMTMTTTAASGHSLSRSMQIWTADDGRSQLIKFLAPADVRGSGFLSVENASGETETMIYLPALGRVRRVVRAHHIDRAVAHGGLYLGVGSAAEALEVLEQLRAGGEPHAHGDRTVVGLLAHTPKEVGSQLLQGSALHPELGQGLRQLRL